MIHSVLASEQRLGRVEFRPLCLSAVLQDCCLGRQPGLKHLLIHSQLHLHPARARVATSVQVVAVRCAGAEEVPYKDQVMRWRHGHFQWIRSHDDVLRQCGECWTP